MSLMHTIGEHLRKSPITPLQALKQYGCFRLADVIYQLKRKGWIIEKDMIEVETQHGKTHVAEYYLVVIPQERTPIK